MDELLDMLLIEMADADVWAERIVSADARAARLSRLAAADNELTAALDAGDEEAIDLFESEAGGYEQQLGFR